MHARSQPRIPMRTGRTTWLGIALLGLAVLTGAGIPPLTIVAASELAPSPSPSTSFGPLASPASSADPGATPEPSASAGPGPSAAPSSTPIASPTPPPGAVATVASEGQPYNLPAFVGLGGIQTAFASFYGPGFYCISDSVSGCDAQAGRVAWPKLTACGVLYTQTVIGVASRTLPCGTLVAFSYAGRTVVAPVIDRGPYVPGRLWDLSGGLCTALHHCFTGPIRWAVVRPAIGTAATVRIDLRRL